MIADDEADQSATSAAFSLLHTVARQRLARGRLTVIDATNVEPRARRPLIGLARRFDVAAVAIVFDLPADVVPALEHRTDGADRAGRRGGAPSPRAPAVAR